MDSEQIELVLANRTFLYSLLARAYAEEIDGGFIDIFTSDLARQEVALVDDESNASILLVYGELKHALLAEGARAEVSHEFVRVFVGPGTLKAEPWETVQLSGKHALFQPAVLEIREAYRSSGFEPKNLRQVPDDSIGMELDFMAKLACKTQEAWEQGDDATVKRMLSQSSSFLERHLLKWIDRLASSIERAYGECFYALFTEFASLVIKRDARLLKNI